MGDIVVSVAAKVPELWVEPVTKRIGYAFNYKDNIRELKEEVAFLIDARGSVNHRVEEAARNGEDIEDELEMWLKRVQMAIDGANEVIGDESRAQRKKCFIGWCPDLKTRYQVSRTVGKQTEACGKLRGDEHFDRDSYYQPPEHVFSMRYEDFESRTSVLEAIGEYGMGGVGKTILVKRLAEQFKKKRLFEVVVMTIVTQNMNLKRIQGEIVDYLDLKFGDVQTLVGRRD